MEIRKTNKKGMLDFPVILILIGCFLVYGGAMYFHEISMNDFRDKVLNSVEDAKEIQNIDAVKEELNKIFDIMIKQAAYYNGRNSGKFPGGSCKIINDDDTYLWADVSDSHLNPLNENQIIDDLENETLCLMSKYEKEVAESFLGQTYLTPERNSIEIKLNGKTIHSNDLSLIKTPVFKSEIPIDKKDLINYLKGGNTMIFTLVGDKYTIKNFTVVGDVTEVVKKVKCTESEINPQSSCKDIGNAEACNAETMIACCWEPDIGCTKKGDCICFSNYADCGNYKVGGVSVCRWTGGEAASCVPESLSYSSSEWAGGGMLSWKAFLFSKITNVACSVTDVPETTVQTFASSTLLSEGTSPFNFNVPEKFFSNPGNFFVSFEIEAVPQEVANPFYNDVEIKPHEDRLGFNVSITGETLKTIRKNAKTSTSVNILNENVDDIPYFLAYDKMKSVANYTYTEGKNQAKLYLDSLTHQNNYQGDCNNQNPPYNMPRSTESNATRDTNITNLIKDTIFPRANLAKDPYFNWSIDVSVVSDYRVEDKWCTETPKCCQHTVNSWCDEKIERDNKICSTKENSCDVKQSVTSTKWSCNLQDSSSCTSTTTGEETAFCAKYENCNCGNKLDCTDSDQCIYSYSIDWCADCGITSCSTDGDPSVTSCSCGCVSEQHNEENNLEYADEITTNKYNYTYDSIVTIVINATDKLHKNIPIGADYKSLVFSVKMKFKVTSTMDDRRNYISTSGSNNGTCIRGGDDCNPDENWKCVDSASPWRGGPHWKFNPSPACTGKAFYCQSSEWCYNSPTKNDNQCYKNGTCSPESGDNKCCINGTWPSTGCSKKCTCDSEFDCISGDVCYDYFQCKKIVNGSFGNYTISYDWCDKGVLVHDKKGDAACCGSSFDKEDSLCNFKAEFCSGNCLDNTDQNCKSCTWSRNCTAAEEGKCIGKNPAGEWMWCKDGIMKIDGGKSDGICPCNIIGDTDCIASSVGEYSACTEDANCTKSYLFCAMGKDNSKMCCSKGWCNLNGGSCVVHGTIYTAAGQAFKCNGGSGEWEDVV